MVNRSGHTRPSSTFHTVDRDNPALAANSGTDNPAATRACRSSNTIRIANSAAANTSADTTPADGSPAHNPG